MPNLGRAIYKFESKFASKMKHIILVKFAVSIICITLGFERSNAQELSLIIPKGHTNTVTHFEVTNDYKYVVSTDGSNEIVVWDYESGKQITNLSVSGAVTLLHSFDSQILIGLRNGGVLVFDPAEFRLTQISSFQGTVVNLVSSSNRIIAVTNNGMLHYLDLKGTRLDSLKININPTTATRVDNEIVIGSSEGEIYKVNLDRREIVGSLKVAESAINAVHYLEVKDLIGISDNRGNITLVNYKSFEILKSYPVFGLRARGFYFNSDSTLLAVGRDDQSNLKELNINNGRVYDRSIWPDQGSYTSFALGLYPIMEDRDNGYFVPSYERNFYRVDSVGNKTEYTGEAGVINQIAVDPDGVLLAIASARDEIQIVDLTGRNNPKSYKLNASPTSLLWIGTKLYAGLDNGLSARISEDSTSYLNPKITAEYPTTAIGVYNDESHLLRKYAPTTLHAHRLEDMTLAKITKKAGFTYHINPKNNDLLVINSKGMIEQRSALDFKRKLVYDLKDVDQFLLTKDGDKIIALTSKEITILDYNSGKVTNRFNLTKPGATSLYVSPKGKQVLLTFASREKGSSLTEYYIQVIDGETGNELFRLDGHKSLIKDIDFIKGGDFILTASADGTIKIWDDKGNALGNVIPLVEGEHVVVGEDGLFDATATAMKKLAYLQKDEVILLDQVKDRYYEPGLLAKILKFSNEQKRNVTPLNHVKLYPEIELLHPMKNDGILGVKLTAREGGIGRIVVLINGKEIESNPAQNANNLTEFDIINHPYVLIGDLNKISVKVYNEAMDAVSQPRNLYYLDKQKPEDVKPKLYGLSIGVSNYQGDHLDLKYAAKDAEDIANAISISSQEYLGKENVSIKVMTTTSDSLSTSWPSKENISKALAEIAENTTARDILFLYISGHGEVDEVNTNEFYYLTADAGKGNIEDDNFRKKALISNYELFRLLQQVPTLRQVLIIDACHSGSLVESLSGKVDVTMGATQIRSLEQLKDRANVYVLAGSAADAVSYESSIYGQGLLTYSLLMGMKGAALRENQYVDILQLFNYASSEVPELAKEVGGIQKPEIKIPSTGSFDIGQLNDEAKKSITVSTPKPLFIHSIFQHESIFFDDLNLGTAVDKKLRLLDRTTEVDLVFLNTNHYQDAFAIRGRYTVLENNEITASIKLFKDRGQVGEFEITAPSVDAAVDKILEGVLGRIKPLLQEN